MITSQHRTCINNDDDDWINLSNLSFDSGALIPRRWVENDEVEACHRCGSHFSFWRRRHHCRNCGQIFCFDCCNYFRTINNLLKTGTQRVCVDCVKTIDKQSEQYRLWSIFSFLDLKDIKRLMPLAKRFYVVGKAYQKTLRAIQYYPIDHRLLNEEKDVLLNNIDYLSGHSRWITSLLKISDDRDILTRARVTHCNNLGCGIGCESHLSVEDLVQIIVSLPSASLTIQYCCKKVLEMVSQEEAKALIPLLISRAGLKPIRDLLLELSQKSDVLLYMIYWESMLSSKSMTDEIDRFYFQLGSKKKLLDGVRYTFLELSFLNTSEKTQIKTKLSMNNMYFMDRDRIWVANDILLDQIKYKNSKSKPICFPFVNQDKQVKRFLYKADNLKKDYIITKVISLMIFYIKQELKLDLDFISYQVYLLKNGFGLIEVVESSETINDIRKNNSSNSAILHYILGNNPQETVSSVSRKFINSLAIYSVITYLLGIGDRHLDNIMIHQSGYLFHIDYEYILGEDPKIVSQTMRITTDMLDALGGKNSDNYVMFKNMCSAIFNCLRKHINIFISLLSLLASEQLSKDKIVEEILKRFEPGEKYLNAETYITTIIDNSHDTLTSGLMDTLYKCAKLFR